ncbi:MAG: DUF3047 domain-containing protein [Hyphomicrobiales bacterium]
MGTKTSLLTGTALGLGLMLSGAAVGLAKTPSLIGGGPWKLLKVKGKDVTRFAIVKDREMRVDAKGAVGFLYRQVSDLSEEKLTLRWRWRIDRQIPATDQARKGGDDRAIAVHLWFDDDKSGSLFGRLGSLLGYPRVGHLVTYVWGGVRDPDSVLPNPYYDKGAIIIVRNGAAAENGSWRSEKRDVADDYARAFGRMPDLSKLRYIAISADTDDTGTESSARVADVTLRAM